MQAMEQAMGGGCQDDTDIGDESYAAEQGIYRRKYFTTSIFDLYHRAHATEYHGGVVQCIYPNYVRAIVITEYTEEQTQGKYEGGKKHAPDDAGVKDRLGG